MQRQCRRCAENDRSALVPSLRPRGLVAPPGPIECVTRGPVDAACPGRLRDAVARQLRRALRRSRSGALRPARRRLPRASVSWRADVQPILQRRCVVCHGCYDAPCQLKLGAWQGVARGGSSEEVYDATRLREAAPSRLFVDAQLPSQWRAKGFFPVLNERSPTPEAQLAGSLLYQTLVLKQQHPLPAGPVLGEGFDFSLDRAQACPRIEQFEDHARKSPLAGMPYGLPGLDAREMDTLARWLRAGAPYEGDAPLTALQRQQVQAWEAFLNGPSHKERLMSRYLYEHLFLGHLHFDGRCHAPRLPPGALEHAAGPADADHRHAPALRRPRRRALLVPARARARSHPGQDAHALCAEPGAHGQVPRLVPGPARCRSARCRPTRWRWRAIPSSPSRELPIDARYRFLLDEAQFFIMNFIKGPVCRGQMAVDVIEDQLLGRASSTRRPMTEAIQGELLLRQAEQTDAAGREGQRFGPARAVAEDGAPGAQLPADQERGAEQELRQRQAKLDLSLIWDGEGRNRNAALTIFRHFDSASVVQGFVGAPPKTAWVIDYPLFERIYYLLVGRLRRLRQRRPPAEQPPVHGLHAHGRRVQLPGVPAAGAAREHGAVLVPRRHRRGARIRLRQERLPRRRKRRALPQR